MTNLTKKSNGILAQIHTLPTAIAAILSSVFAAGSLVSI